VSLGQKLNMTVLAEEIETKQQLGRRREFECDVDQGFLFTPVVRRSEADALISGRLAP